MARTSLQPAALLAAIPIRNTLVRAAPLSSAQTRLTAPLKPGLLKGFLAVKASEKSFDLDELGLAVWNACDGRQSVEQIVTAFARTHRLNPREAQVAVCTFLRTLMRRNLIALVTENQKPKKKGKR